MSFNKITIVGYLGRDPELKTTPQGTALCKFSVATTERKKGATGEQEELTTWFRVTVWGRQAELANEYLSKGRQVYVEGRLRVEEYTDREGNTRSSLEVNATDLQFLGQRNDNNAPAAAASVPYSTATKKEPVAVMSLKAKTKVAPRKTNPALVSIEEDDVPF
ncbi:MAG: single-stranded DNA-binding protein [Acidobacteria bacterium]|nr:single-stranded DNA-binding protein [Acidobacteriota bacterium]